MLAVFLIDRSRSAVLVREAPGDSLPGVLATEFSAARHAIECRKQRRRAHLLRERAKLRDERWAATVARHIRPLIELLQDALPADAFVEVKSVVRTCRKNGWNLLQDAQAALAAIATGQPPRMPLAASNSNRRSAALRAQPPPLEHEVRRLTTGIRSHR